MPRLSYPTVSVVVCTFNGARGIGECLDSLAAQDYPADEFSIIVVDDGCTDNTAAIVKKYDAQVITHKRNLGVQYARNTGLKAAMGEIIAYLDDDCVVAKDWLRQLVAPFADRNVVAVGGRVVAYKTDHLAERYMEASGYGNPEPLLPGSGINKHLYQRLYAYLRHMYRPITVATQPVAVQAVYTANVAYRASALRGIGGFDSSLRSNEDSDVATRLRAAEGTLMFAPAAAARHRHHQRVWHIVRQTFYRSGDTYDYYRKNHLLPPLFPFPLMYVALTFGLALMWPLAGFACMVVGPVLLYNSWILHAVQTRNIEYVAYAYVQLAREMAALLGFLRAALKFGSHRSVAGAYATRKAVSASDQPVEVSLSGSKS